MSLNSHRKLLQMGRTGQGEEQFKAPFTQSPDELLLAGDCRIPCNNKKISWPC